MKMVSIGSQLQKLLTAKRRFIIVASTLLLVGCIVGRDSRDAREAASRIHGQFSNGDFASIYREATPHFKQLDEVYFASSLQQMRRDYGVMRKATMLAYQTGVDTDVGRSHVIISDLEFERARAKERMVLTRAKDGQMRLWDLIIEPK